MPRAPGTSGQDRSRLDGRHRCEHAGCATRRDEVPRRGAATRCQRLSGVPFGGVTVAMCLSVHKETSGPSTSGARGLSVFFALFERVASRVNRDVRSLSSPEWDPASRQGGAFVPGGNVDKRDGLSLFGAEGDQASRAGAKTRGPLWREKGTGRLFLRHSWSGTTPGPRETAGPFHPRKGTARLGGATRSSPSDSVKRRPVPFPRGKRTERLFLRRRNEGGSLRTTGSRARARTRRTTRRPRGSGGHHLRDTSDCGPDPIACG